MNANTLLFHLKMCSIKYQLMNFQAVSKLTFRMTEACEIKGACHEKCSNSILIYITNNFYVISKIKSDEDKLCICFSFSPCTTLRWYTLVNDLKMHTFVTVKNNFFWDANQFKNSILVRNDWRTCNLALEITALLRQFK